MNAMTCRAESISDMLFLALDLGGTSWKLAFGVTRARAPRVRTIAARDLVGLLQEIALAKRRFQLAADAPVRSCYEAGRDGFWLHRALLAHGVESVVVEWTHWEQIEARRRMLSEHVRRAWPRPPTPSRRRSATSRVSAASASTAP